MKLISLSLLTCSLLLTGLDAQGWEHEWTTQDVLLPRSEPGSDFFWFGGIPLGDLDLDQRMDYFLEGRTLWDITHNPVYENQSRFFSGLGVDEAFRFYFDSNFSRFEPTSNPREPDFAAVRTPLGPRLFVLDLSINDLAIVDFRSRGILGYAEQPATHTVWGGLSGYDGVFRAGDLNSDGFEDAFYHAHSTGGARMFGAISGSDFSLLWSHFEPFPNGDLQPNRNLELSANADLDGDGTPDLVASFTAIDVIPWELVGVIKAFSGADGAVLWENRRNNSSTYGNNGGWKDVTGDGTPDFFRTIQSGNVPQNNLVEMFDGANGSILWQTNWNVLDHLFPPGDYQPNRFSFFQTSPDILSALDLVQVTRYNSHPDEWGTTIYDAASGTFLDYAPFPTDQLPWFPDSMNTAFSVQWYMPIGDIDRDGFVEIFHDAPISQYDEPTVNGQPRAGHILSQRTLALPTTIAPGSVLQADILIPTGPGRPCTLLLSTEFDNTGGLVLGEDWRTHLAPSPLLTMSLANRPFSTTLDPQGEGSIQLGIPNNPGLIGTTIYARAIIQETVGSPEIWTVTTLGMTEIQ